MNAIRQHSTQEGKMVACLITVVSCWRIFVYFPNSQLSFLFHAQSCRPTRAFSFEYKLNYFDNPTLSTFDHTHVAIIPYQHCKQEPKHRKILHFFGIASAACFCFLFLGFDENDAPFSDWRYELYVGFFCLKMIVFLHGHFHCNLAVWFEC